MGDFKPGDEIWWFYCMEEDPFSSLEDIRIGSSVYIKEDERCIMTNRCLLSKAPNQAYFKSKNEAIDAMIGRFEEMRDQ